MLFRDIIIKPCYLVLEFCFQERMGCGGAFVLSFSFYHTIRKLHGMAKFSPFSNLLFVICILSLPLKAWAFSCRMPSVEDAYKAAEAVFTGKVVGGVGSTKCGAKVMSVEVEERFKGQVADVIDIHSSDACTGGGVYMAKGVEYLVYANKRNDGRYSVWGCSRTKALPWAEKNDEIGQIKELVDRFSALDRAMQKNPEDKAALTEAKIALYKEYNDYAAVAALYRQQLGEGALAYEAEGLPVIRNEKDLQLLRANAYRNEEIRSLPEVEQKAIAEKVQKAYEWLKANKATYPVRIKLIEALHKLKDAEGIYEVTSTFSEHVPLSEAARAANSFALFALGKKEEVKNHYLNIENNAFHNLDYSRIALPKVHLKAVQIADSNFSDTEWGGELEDVRFTQVDLRRARFLKAESHDRATLRKVQFNSSDLEGTNFDGAEVTMLTILNSDLADASMRGMLWSGGQIYGSLGNVDLTNAKLIGVSLYNADMSEAKLSGVDLSGSEYSCRTKWPKGFDPQKAGAIIENPVCSERAKGMRENRFKPDAKALEEQSASKDPYDISMRNEHQIKHQVWIVSGWDISHLPFKNEELARKSDFTKSELGDADFSGSKGWETSFYLSRGNAPTFSDVEYQEPTFIASKLSRAVFDDAFIVRGKFDFAKMPKASFKDAKLIRSSFEGGDFSHADFTGVILDFSHLSEAIKCHTAGYSGGATCSDHYASGSYKAEVTDFSHANFTDASLQNTMLAYVDFSHAKLEGADLGLAQYTCGTKWPKGYKPAKAGAILFSDAPCNEGDDIAPDLRRRNLNNARLNGARALRLEGANFEGATLRNAELSDVNLSDALLENADLTALVFNCGTIWPEDFNPIARGAVFRGSADCEQNYPPAQLEKADLSNMNLFDAPLSKANLRGANLQNAQLGRADLFRADLRSAQLQGADMSSANINEAQLKGAIYDCNTLWPDHIQPKDTEAVQAEGECVQTNKKQPHFIRALSNDWR